MRRMFFVLGVIATITITVRAAEYRLFNDRFLDVGNEWRYQMHIYIWDNESVNFSGEGTLKISGASNVGGYETSVLDIVSPWDTSRKFFSILPDSIIMAAMDSSDDNVHKVFRNNDPPEVYPIWIDESDSNRHFGHGEMDVAQDEPSMSWTTTYDDYITYRGRETITVQAGSFECIKVFMRSDWVDSDGYYGYTEDTIWVDPRIGIIKSDTYDWMYDAYYDEVTASAYEWDLVSTNVPPEPFCRVRSVPMDFTGDCRVNLADFAVFMERWMDCELDPPEACWE